jgi:hypothetical protein
MHRMTQSAILLLSAVCLCACEEALTDPTSEPATFTASPDPAVATPSHGVTYTIESDDGDEVIEYPWKTSFTITMQETAGVGRDITAMSVRVQQAAGGIVITPTGSQIEHYQFTSQASGNRLEANGSASVSFEVWYDLPNDGREALVTVTFSFLDDNSSSFSEIASVRVQ